MAYYYHPCKTLSVGVAALWVLLNLLQSSDAFQPSATTKSTFLGRQFTSTTSSSLAASRRTLVKERTFDPMGLAQAAEEGDLLYTRPSLPKKVHEAQESSPSTALSLATTASALTALVAPQPAQAASALRVDPAGFQPVCPASDGFYRLLQNGAETVVGKESAEEYGPLISGGLLRVRLELCVVESFFNEAVGPFIAKNGLSWILPLHETVETFIAGTVFALAATFILIGSTKIVTVVVTYADFLIGFPSRLFGGFFYDRALGKPVTLDVGIGPFKTRLVGPPVGTEDTEVKLDLTSQGPIALAVISVSGLVKLVGLALKVLREISDAIDIFVGRYLVVWASGYIAIKFLHFKVFPDILDNPFDLSMF